MLSQPLLSFPSAVPLGGEGLLGACPRLLSPKGKDLSHMHPGHRALWAAPVGLSGRKGGRMEALLTPARAATSRNCKSPVRRGAEGLEPPGPPNAA